MTKTKWVELTPKQQWDVLVSLRGPDCQHSESIKWLTTAVIRWAMHSILRVGGTINSTLPGVIIPFDYMTLETQISAGQGKSVLSWSPAHFFQHVEEAAQILGIPVYTVPPDVYIKAAAKHSSLKVLYVLWQWAKTDGRDPTLQTILSNDIKGQTNQAPEVLEAQEGISCLL